MSVESGLLRGLVLGSAVVSVEVADLRVSFPVEVLDRTFDRQQCRGQRRSVGTVMMRERTVRGTRKVAVRLRCTRSAGLRCVQKELAGGIVTRADRARAVVRCCCIFD